MHVQYCCYYYTQLIVVYYITRRSGRCAAWTHVVVIVIVQWHNPVPRTVRRRDGRAAAAAATTSRRWRRSETPVRPPPTTTGSYYSRTSQRWTPARSAPFTARCCWPAATAAGRHGLWSSNGFGRRAAAVADWTCTSGSGARTSYDCCSTFIPVKNKWRPRERPRAPGPARRQSRRCGRPTRLLHFTFYHVVVWRVRFHGTAVRETKYLLTTQRTRLGVWLTRVRRRTNGNNTTTAHDSFVEENKSHKSARRRTVSTNKPRPREHDVRVRALERDSPAVMAAEFHRVRFSGCFAHTCASRSMSRLSI